MTVVHTDQPTSADDLRRADRRRASVKFALLALTPVGAYLLLIAIAAEARWVPLAEAWAGRGGPVDFTRVALIVATLRLAAAMAGATILAAYAILSRRIGFGPERRCASDLVRRWQAVAARVAAHPFSRRLAAAFPAPRPDRVATLAAAILAIALTAAVVSGFTGAYFHAFDDAPFSSQASRHALVLARLATHADHPMDWLVARQFNAGGAVVAYPHYTNGYPLLLRAALVLGGDRVVTGRCLALLLFLLGGVAFAAALPAAYRPAALLAVPLALATSTGRDAATFLLYEPTQTFVLGATCLVFTRVRSAPWRVLTVLAAAFLYEVSLAMVAVAALVAYAQTRDLRRLALDAAAVAVAALLAVVALAHAAGGLGEIVRIVGVRTSLGASHLAQVGHVTAGGALAVLLGDLRANLGAWYPLWLAGGIALGFALPGAPRGVLVALVGFVAYAMVFRNHVAHHPFTRLPFVWLMALTLLLAAQRLAYAAKVPRRLAPFLFLAAGILATIAVAQAPPRLSTDSEVVAREAEFVAFVERHGAELAICRELTLADADRARFDRRLVMDRLSAAYLAAAQRTSGLRCVLEVTADQVRAEPWPGVEKTPGGF